MRSSRSTKGPGYGIAGPPTCRSSSTDDAAKEQSAIGPVASDIVNKARKGWSDTGGELISLPADEAGGDDERPFPASVPIVSKTKPLLDEAYKIVTDAAKRTQ